MARGRINDMKGVSEMSASDSASFYLWVEPGIKLGPAGTLGDADDFRVSKQVSTMLTSALWNDESRGYTDLKVYSPVPRPRTNKRIVRVVGTIGRVSMLKRLSAAADEIKEKLMDVDQFDLTEVMVDETKAVPESRG